MEANFLKQLFLDCFCNEERCVNCEHSIYFLFFSFTGHNSSFRTEAGNLEAKSPKERLNLEKPDSLLPVRKKYNQGNF